MQALIRDLRERVPPNEGQRGRTVVGGGDQISNLKGEL